MRLHLLTLVVTFVTFLACSAAHAADRPNILWITCEDSSPHLGCYGDPLAVTPNLDALAKQSVRYTNAFAYTGVCAPSRSCLITGVYPLRLGSHHMRSTTKLPDEVKCFTEHLRQAGYYCTNNVKEDYNFKTPKTAWDESSKTAHWRDRPDKQTPFFAVFNFTVSHQSQIFGPDEKARKAGTPPPATVHDPAKVTVPPIHPDTPEFRREWARHFDNVTKMDGQAGEILKQLAADGLADDTIVFFYSDHGTGMPSVKMWAWDASLRVPLLVRFPEKWKQWQPAEPGSTSDRLVSFVDFGPTALSLAGIKPPAVMQGEPFLGEHAVSPRQYVFGGKDRQGECYDAIRYVHDGRFHYLRNYRPELPYSQFMSYVEQHASMRAWRALHAAGKLEGTPARFFQTKPTEELYDVQADPWETKNLAADPRYAAELNRLRAELSTRMLAAGDLGLLPEYEMRLRSEGSTPYEIATDANKNPLQVLMAAADVANARDPSRIGDLEALLGNADSAVRWWGTIGLVSLGKQAAPAEAAIRKAMQDDAPNVRISAAEAIANLGHDADALAVLTDALKHESALVRVAALRVLSRMGDRAKPAVEAIRKTNTRDPKQPDAAEYVSRMVEYLPDQIEGR